MALPIKQLEKLSLSRRNLLRWGLLSLGTAAIAGLPKVLIAQQGKPMPTLTFNGDDFGILNFALLLEEIEAAFYEAVVKSGKISDRTESEYMTALGDHQAAHVQFFRNLLGDKVSFQTSELCFNKAGLASRVSDRNTILNTAVTLEDLGVHAYNWAGVNLTNPNFLVAASSIVSVEARHAAGVRQLQGRPATEPNSDRVMTKAELVKSLNPFLGAAYDELYTPTQIVGIIDSLNILKNPINGALLALPG